MQTHFRPTVTPNYLKLEPPSQKRWDTKKDIQLLYITTNTPNRLQQVAKASSVLSFCLIFSCFCFHLLFCRESQPLRGLKENTNKKFSSLCPLEGSRFSTRSRGWVRGCGLFGSVRGGGGHREFCPNHTRDPLKQDTNSPEPQIQGIRCSTWFLLVLASKRLCFVWNVCTLETLLLISISSYQCQTNYIK